MLHFSESFVGGFFGFGRTYGAVARFECDSIEALERDWPEALRQTADWRRTRKQRATWLHLYFNVPSRLAWDAISFVGARVLVPPASLAPEVRGLGLVIAVFGTPDMEQYLDATLYREATGEPAAEQVSGLESQEGAPRNGTE
jgi:hypothetical protein